MVAPRERRLRARCGGFTLIELAAVVLIVMILAAIGVPGLRTLILTQQIRTASSDLFVAIAAARSEAVTRNAEVVVEPASSDWSDGWVVRTGGGRELRREARSARLSITGPAQVTFRGDGRSAAGGVQFHITAENAPEIEPRCLRLHVNGRPYLRAGVCS